ncbi:MAG: M20/M25/M40 family metallo-hydrolase [Pseudohongiellaceae bacterium]
MRVRPPCSSPRPTVSLRPLLLALALGSAPVLRAAEPVAPFSEAETLQHFQSLVSIESTDPPGSEIAVTEYLTRVLLAEGIEVETYALPDQPQRPNLVARLRGNGSKRPLLLMAHQDTVNVDAARWAFPPFSATRDSGWIYGRGTLDDKDNLTASLVTMLALKRSGAVLDRDVIFLAESGEEGAFHVGIKFMVANHYDAIDAEFCLAEGGSVRRVQGRAESVGIGTTEKLPRALALTAHGIAGHASVPLQSNAVVRLSRAITRVAEWQPPVRLSDITTSYFAQLARIASDPASRARYQAVLNPGSPEAAAAIAYFRAEEPATAAILSSTVSPTLVDAGYRINVIPSETSATLDTRLLPDESEAEFLAAVTAVVADPSVEVSWVPRDDATGASSSLDTDAYRIIERVYAEAYQAPVLPLTGTGATDSRFLRAKGMQCYGVGPGIDAEDAPLGYGAHSDQERILESELQRFVKTYYDIVVALAAP